jgi:transposase
MEVDWAGQTAGVVDTDTGEIIDAYIFVATLPYSGYSRINSKRLTSKRSWAKLRKHGSQPMLNEVIKERLHLFNHKAFQKKDGSRATLFAEERATLLPMPATPYELAIWSYATVRYDYHVQADEQYYSVPFEYIKSEVHVRLTHNIVEVLYEGTRLCSHIRLYGQRGQFSTQEAHM